MLLLVCIFYVLVLIFFEMAETALFNISKGKIVTEYNDNIANKLLFLHNNSASVLIMILLIENIVAILLTNIFNTILSSIDLMHYYEITNVVFGFFLTFLFVLAKVFAIHILNTSVLFSVYPTYYLFQILKPITDLLKNLSHWTIGLFYTHTNSHVVDFAKYRLELLYELDNEVEDTEEVDMMKNILSIRDISIDQIMTSKQDFVMVEFKNTPRILDEILNCKKKQIILWEDEEENVIGTIDIMEFFQKYITKKHFKINEDCINDFNIRDIIISPKFALNNMTLYQALHFFKTSKQHILFVINEYGNIIGLITLDDILNDIVGDYDSESYELIEQNNYIKFYNKYKVEIDFNEYHKSFLIDATFTIRDFNKQEDFHLPENHITMSGLIIESLKRVPEIHDIFTFNNHTNIYKFTILEKHKNMISMILLQIKPKEIE